MRAVAVGGGHGTAVSLRALRVLTEDVTGVVSVADDGGSSGRLRTMLDVAAVGDLRICLGALADPANPLGGAFEHRFGAGELDGHALGNLVLVGLIDATGDLEASVRAVAQVLGVTGAIVPASTEGVILVARTDERTVRGQSAVKQLGGPRHLSVEPPDPRSPAAAIEAITGADLVLIGPGSLYTSVLAACVVPEVRDALAATSARTVYVANLFPEEPETAGFTLQDHLDALACHGVEPDVVLVDEVSVYADQPCAAPTVRRALSGRNGMVHDVQKLAQAIRALCEG